jgi:chaperonin GroES
MKFEPLHAGVLIKMPEVKAKSEGGIILPGSAQEKPLDGIVVAVGQGAPLADGDTREMTIKVGDRVLLPKMIGVTLHLDGKPFVLAQEDEILGRFVD